MPYTEVMHKFKHGQLHSGSKSGPVVKNRSQALAILMSEKRAAGAGKKEYQPKKYYRGGEIDSKIPMGLRKGGHVKNSDVKPRITLRVKAK